MSNTHEHLELKAIIKPFKTYVHTNFQEVSTPCSKSAYKPGGVSRVNHYRSANIYSSTTKKQKNAKQCEARLKGKKYSGIEETGGFTNYCLMPPSRGTR